MGSASIEIIARPCAGLFITANSEQGRRRGVPAYQCGPQATSPARRRLFALQIRQNSLDNGQVFNTGNDLDLTVAPLAGLDIDPGAAQLNTHLSRCIQVIDT